MNILDGTEIIKLIGLPESDDRVLDLIEALEVDVREIERDEDDGSYDIDLENEVGLNLSFDDIAWSDEQKNNPIGGQYLNSITLYDNFMNLPFSIKKKDALSAIEKKIGKKSNYLDIEDSNILYWMYEDLGWFTIFFNDNTHQYVEEINIKPYANPEDENPEREGINEFMKPYVR